jgi:uncharacterized coiled-coil DUF342 family protein
MNYKKINAAVISAIVGITLLSVSAMPAFAQGTASTSATNLRMRAQKNAANTVARVTQTVNRAITEITNRVNALTSLETRVNAIQKLSSGEKSSLSSQIQTQITTMKNLQAQITADGNGNSTSSLKTDMQSITKAYRIYALIIPQGTIAAAGDRATAIASAITTLSGSLQTRITQAQAAGATMTSSISALADLKAKAADADAQAQAAIDKVASLVPDNGNATVLQANNAALKAARTDIQTAQKDLVTARQDAQSIIQAIKAAEKTQAATSTASNP